MDNGTLFDIYQTRSNRLTGSNRAPSKSSVTSDFELGKSAWNSSSNIWRNTTRRLDGVADEELSRPSPVRHSSSTSYRSGVPAMGNLTTPNDIQNGNGTQSVSPWSASIASDTFAPRQALQTSPVKQRTNESFATSTNMNGHGEGADLLTGSTPFEDEQSMRTLLAQRLPQATTSYRSSAGHREPRHAYANADHQNSQNMNAASFARNNALSTSAVPREASNLPRSALRTIQTPSYSNGPVMSRQVPALSRADSDTASQFQVFYNSASPTSRKPSDSSRSDGYVGAFSGSFDGVDETTLGMGNLTFGPDQHLSKNLREHYDTRPQTQNASLQMQPEGLSTEPRLSFTNRNGYTQSLQNGTNEHTGAFLLGNQAPHSNAQNQGDRGTYTPINHDLRSHLHSPYYSTANTPPTAPDSLRSPTGSGISSRTSHYDAVLLDRKLRNLDTHNYDLGVMQNLVPFGPPFEYPLAGSGVPMNPNANMYIMPSYPSVGNTTAGPKMSTRELDQTQILRSAILEDFRLINKTNKRYELKDIYNHIVEFSGDQHGSRFIQQKLETANSDEKEQVFKEIQPNSLQLMTDVFGNYVIQKMFEHGNQTQKKILADKMKGQILNLSTQMYGCRVVQKALEHVLTDQQASMVKELDGANNSVLKVIKDQNGNHVVQKAIERVPAEHVQFIVDAHRGQVITLARHTYGCRVIQRILEHCEPSAKRVILDELHHGVLPLISDAFGNYVIQHVIQNGEPSDRRRVVAIVQHQLLYFSKHKFASNVVEKCLEFADEDQRKDILRQLIGANEHGQTPVLGLLRDQYGNYVIQKVYSLLQGPELEALVAEMKQSFPTLRRVSYGKQVIAIEKLLYGSGPPPSLATSGRSSTLASTAASSSEDASTPPETHFAKQPAMHETLIALPMGMGPPQY